MILGMFWACRVNSIHVHRRQGLLTMHYSPVALELPSLGGKPLLFKRSGGTFRLMWSGGIVWCNAGECWGQGGVCMHVSVCVRAVVRVTWQGYISQRAAGPDVWLPLTVHSRRGWSGEGPTPSPPFPRTKAKAQLIDVNSVAFVPKAQRHAEREIWPLPRVRLCLWTRLAVSGSLGQRVREQARGCRCVPTWQSVQVVVVGGRVLRRGSCTRHFSYA